MHGPHGGTAAARPRGGRELPGRDVGGHDFVGHRQPDLLQLVPGAAPDDTVRRQPKQRLERLHRADRRRAVAAVHGHGAQRAVVVRCQPQPKLHEPHLHADSTPPQRCARPRRTAQVALRIDPRGVQRVPCALPDCAVRRQALLLLERPHGPLGCRAVAAVHRHAHQRRIELRQIRKPELHLLHAAARAAAPQNSPRPAARALGALGGLALARQLGQVLDADINKAHLVPRCPADHTVRRQAELLLKFFHAVLGGLVKRAGHGGLAEGRVVPGNAGQLLLQDAHIRSGGPAPQRAARIAGRDGGNVVGCDQLHAAAVVVPQDLQRVHALPCAVHRAPLLHAGAGYGFAVAILGKVRLGVTAALDKGAEQLGGQPLHDRKHRAPVDIGLVVPRRPCDVEAVPAAGVPLGPDAVQRQTDLRNNVGAQGLFRPGKRAHPIASRREKWYTDFILV